MPGIAISKVAKTSAYMLIIDNKGMNRFVEADKFNGFKQQCESDSIWDFWTDNIDITLDQSAFDRLGYNETNYHNMLKLPVEFYYYNKRVFGGIIGDASYSKDDQSIELELHSYGRVIKGISGSLTMYGFTAENIAKRIIDMCNQYLTQNSYPFTIDNLSLDLIDFPFYKSLARDFTKDYYEFAPFPSTKFNDFVGIYYRGEQYYLVFRQSESTFSLYEFDQATGNIDNINVQFPIIKKTLKNYRTGNLTPVFDSEKKDSNGDPLPDVNNLPDGAVDIIKASLGDYVASVVPDGNTGYFAGTYGRTIDGEFYDFRLVHFVISEVDVYWCKYEDDTAGDMLKDLAIMTNSYFWIAPDTTAYFQTREYGIIQLDAVNAINFKSLIIRRDSDFKIPDKYLVLKDVQDDINSYFTGYLSGDFYIVEATVFKNDISVYPPLLNDLPIKPALQKGLIKSVDYMEDVLNIKSEFRVANNG